MAVRILDIRSPPSQRLLLAIAGMTTGVRRPKAMLFCTLFIALTLLGVADAETTVAPTDVDQRLVYQLYDYLVHVDHHIKKSRGYERLRQAMNKTAKVLDFFESLGDLYDNGTLGGCRRDESSCNERSCHCILYSNANYPRFNAEFGRFLTQDRSQNSTEEFTEDLLPRWDPDRVGLDDAYYVGRLYLDTIFNRTMNSYNYLRTKIANGLLEMSPNGSSPLRHCFYFPAEQNDRHYFEYDTALRACTSLATVMARTCDNNRTSTDYANSLQDESENFAKNHGFNGGRSNRCFAKFVVRYNNYTTEANERFVDYVAEYLYRDTLLHGLCIPFSVAASDKIDAAERTRRKNWVKERVDIIGTGIFDARAVLDETPPTAPPSEGIRTHTANQTWICSVKAAIETAIGQEEIPYPTPNDAFQLYKGIHGQILTQLHQLGRETKHVYDTVNRPFDVLVYYPAHDSTKHCVKNASNNVLFGSVKNVNYVVSLRNHQNANATLVTKSKIEEYFKKLKESDECARINGINDKMGNNLLTTKRLRALVSIKCARKFVWYELAYQYFQAAYTEAPKVETDHSSKYSDNCGMLVLVS